MPWTREQQLAALLRMPWTVTIERDNDDKCLIARVAEIPSALATGASEKELSKNLWDSLRASLEVYIEYDDAIPLPPAVQRLPWQTDPDARNTQSVQVSYRRGAIWSERTAETALIETVERMPVPA